jgi:hypothetical protein
MQLHYFLFLVTIQICSTYPPEKMKRKAAAPSIDPEEDQPRIGSAGSGMASNPDSPNGHARHYGSHEEKYVFNQMWQEHCTSAQTAHHYIWDNINEQTQQKLQRKFSNTCSWGEYMVFLLGFHETYAGLYRFGPRGPKVNIAAYGASSVSELVAKQMDVEQSRLQLQPTDSPSPTHSPTSPHTTTSYTQSQPYCIRNNHHRRRNLQEHRDRWRPDRTGHGVVQIPAERV